MEEMISNSFVGLKDDAGSQLSAPHRVQPRFFLPVTRGRAFTYKLLSYLFILFYKLQCLVNKF